jgi:hypothetical protein
MTARFMMIDALESRTLLTGTPNPLVVADTIQLQADTAKLKADTAQCAALLKADKAAVDAATRALNSVLEPRKGKLKIDEATWTKTLKADAAAITAAENAARPKITADLKKIAADKAGSEQLAADKAKLEADQAYVKSVMDPLRAKYMSDTDAMKTALAADHAAIDAVDASAIAAAKLKLQGDSKECEALLKSDNAAIKYDQEKLKKDTKETGGGDQKKNPK